MVEGGGVWWWKVEFQEELEELMVFLLEKLVYYKGGEENFECENELMGEPSYSEARELPLPQNNQP